MAGQPMVMVNLVKSESSVIIFRIFLHSSFCAPPSQSFFKHIFDFLKIANNSLANANARHDSTFPSIDFLLTKLNFTTHTIHAYPHLRTQSFQREKHANAVHAPHTHPPSLALPRLPLSQKHTFTEYQWIVISNFRKYVSICLLVRELSNVCVCVCAQHRCVIIVK